MLTSSYNRERVLELCKEYGIEVKEGKGNMTLNGKEFDFKAIMENAIPSSILSIEISSATRAEDIFFKEEGKTVQYSKSFSLDKYPILAA